MKNMKHTNSKHSTTRRRRHNQYTGKLTAFLLTGSVIATAAGTQILPLQDAAKDENPVATTEPVTVIVPADDSSSITLPPGERRTQIEMKPIPQVIQPRLRPLARSRSS